MTLRDDALDLARAGIAVFPCDDRKQPLTAHGFHDATIDAAQVGAWWDANPDALLARPVPEGFVVIDVDPRNGGDESLRALLREHGRDAFDSATMARTRGAGFHYWFRVPYDTPARLRKQLAPGIDVRAAGKSYVIVPPSPGYTWRRRTDTDPVAPAWLLDAITRPEVAPSTPGEARPPRFAPFEEGTRYGLSAREREVGRLVAAAEGTRNDALNRAAFSVAQLVAGGELDEASTRATLWTAAERIGLEPEEIDLTLESGWSAGSQEPRNAPEDSPRLITHGDVLELPGTRTAPASTPGGGTYWTDWRVDEPAPPFWLEPVLPKNAYVLVYGATEAAKSMVWAAILADGSRRGLKSSVYSLENPRHVDRSRLRRLRPDPCCFRITHEPLDLGMVGDVEALVEREREWGTNVVMIDTYSHAFNSFRSDDGNARAIAFAQVVRHVMHELNDQGLSVVVIDHTGYQNPTEPRDASAKRQQVDVAIHMQKEGEWVRGAREAHFAMTNFKASRFANPFADERGKIVGARDEDLRLEWTSGDGFPGRWDVAVT